MGWADCGVNAETGDQMGYAHEGVCHRADCCAEIDHGLAHVCGGMHGGGDHGCGRYFCEKHLSYSGLCEQCREANGDNE